MTDLFKNETYSFRHLPKPQNIEEPFVSHLYHNNQVIQIPDYEDLKDLNSDLKDVRIISLFVSHSNFERVPGKAYRILPLNILSDTLYSYDLKIKRKVLEFLTRDTSLPAEAPSQLVLKIKYKPKSIKVKIINYKDRECVHFDALENYHQSLDNLERGYTDE